MSRNDTLSRRTVCRGLAGVGGAAVLFNSPAKAQLLSVAGSHDAVEYFVPRPIAAVQEELRTTPPVGGALANVLRLAPTPLPLPTIPVFDQFERPVMIADFVGRVLLLNVWASWCPPCREEMPQLSQLQARVGGPDFTVIAISQDETMQRAQEFMAAVGIRNLPLYHDRSRQFGAALNVVGLPMTVLVDKAAQVRAFVYGAYAWDSVEVVEFITYFLDA